MTNNSDKDLSTRGSRAVGCLEEAWRMICSLEPCLPECVIVILAAGDRGKRGHFSGCVWRAAQKGKGHEVAVNPQLFDKPEDLLATLVHEAAHGLLFEWGCNGGCGKDGYYHREEFANVCRKLGLACSFNDKRLGWSITAWPETGVPDRYQKVLELLRSGMPWGLEGRGGESFT